MKTVRRIESLPSHDQGFVLNTPAADSGNEQPFPHRLLEALVTDGKWDDLAALAVEAWIRLAGACAALLVSPVGPTQLQVVSCRLRSGNGLQAGITRDSGSFATLLDRAAVVQTLAEAGLIGGLNVEVFVWPDLAAALLVQFAEDNRLPAADGEGIRSTLIPISRQLLARATDRAILIPDCRLLEAMAEFAAGAGHEINNPLGTILGQTQMLLRSEASTERRQTYEMIGAQAWRIRDMIGNSMLFARPPRPQKVLLILTEIVQEALLPLSRLAAESNIELQFDRNPEHIELTADRAQLCTVISQLVRNSIEALRSADRSGTISVILRDELSHAVEMTVVDDGPGIVSEDVRRHMFNPFYSGRSAGRGLGFGLCLVWQIVRMHGGLILLETPATGGTAFHIALPKAQA